eukprot:TRINITY_DN2688_c0_g1_i3.p1 TRINITY_DN2688_c0_g1~~TRINITY_DN2688_c0_g1_i3.p1  ORF type:complete len:950 (-),score=207.32 TRINITY_DN2688_c0_g1_i3:401-3250(-)
MVSNCNFIWVVTSGSYEHIPLRAVRKGNCYSKCSENSPVRVSWHLETDLEDSQQVYLSGSDASLGSWDTDLAIPMSTCRGKLNLWQAEVQIPRGTHEYNYFVKYQNSVTNNIRWRQGPAFSIALPFSRRFLKKRVVQDKWLAMTSDTQQVDTVSLESLDTEKQRVTESSDMPYEPIEEPWLPINSFPSKEEPVSLWTRLNEVKALVKERESGEAISGAEQKKGKNELQSAPLVTNLEDPLQTVSEDNDTSNVLHLSDMADKIHEKGMDVKTEIIVNSSLCSIKRIAILEDGKPVELLLEPVKANIQLGNIYLGVVRKLLPCMSGAFVDIGDRMLAFLATSKNLKPYTFPPLHVVDREGQTNGLQLQNSATASSSENGDIYNRVDDGVEDDIPLNYEDNLEKNVVPDDAFEEVDITEDENNMGNELNLVVDEHKEIKQYSRANGHIPREENLDKYYAKKGDSTQIIKRSSDPNQDKYIPFQWKNLKVGTKIIVQVIREALGTKGPTVTAFPVLTSRFWVLETRQNQVSVSRKITGFERTRLKKIANVLHRPDFGLKVRSVAEGHSFEELSKDLSGLLETWNGIIDKAESAYIEAEEGVQGAVPVILKRAMGQTLLVVQDYFNEKVQRMVVDSKHTYREVTRYLREFSPSLVDRVELHDERTPIFDKFGVENVIDYILSQRVPLPNGGYLVIQQTEALVSIDVNGGSIMMGRNRSNGQTTESSKEQAILEVNLAAARQIVRELRLRDVGGIIIVDFIDMEIEKHKRMVYEQVKKVVEEDRSSITFSELSDLCLMEMTRRCVRPSVAFKMTEPCPHCHGNGRVETLDTTFSKIERAICRILAKRVHNGNRSNNNLKPRILLRVDPVMHDYLTTGKKKRIVLLSRYLKVLILLKDIRLFARGQFEVTELNEGKASNGRPSVGLVGTKSKRLHSGSPRQKLRSWSFKARRSLNN